MIAVEGAGTPAGADATDVRIRPGVLFALFFASGASGLVYEVVWIRLLSLTLSVTVDAVTTVLCAFMAGLGLGATIGGRLADRLSRPLRAYGVIELVVAATSVATPFVLYRLGPGYVWLYEHLGGTGPAFVLGRFLLAFAVLMIPCSLMGATLPLLSRIAVADRTRVARGTGALYAVNTLGAVAGCLVAGFVLIPEIGLTASNTLAAAVSAAVGVIAVVLGRARGITVLGHERDEGGAWTARGRLVCAAFALSGFTAIGYEVLWTRGLEPFTHNSTYAYSAMLAVFLLGIGLGSAVTAPLADRLRRPLLALGVVEVAIGASVVASLLVYSRFGRFVPAVAEAIGGLTSWSRVVAVIFTEAGVILIATTLLFGATFPLVARVVANSWERLGGRIGAAYTANTVGGIAGALAAGFVLLPMLGMRGAFVTLVVVNLAVGAALALADGSTRAARITAAAAVASAIAAVVLVPGRLFEERFSERFGRLLFYREQVTDTVMVTEDQHGDRMIRYADGRGTAGTISVPEDRMYAHVAMLLHPAARRVLSICFGVGNSLASVLTYPVERVDAVELSPGVVAAAPFFEKTNRNPLADPRVRLIIRDGRNFLLASRDRYDVIRLDPPELHTAGVVNLYTREFFQLARDHLAPGGVFSIWVNIVMTPEEDLRMLARTILSVFPHVTIWRGPYRYSWVFNGTVEPHPPDVRIAAANWARPAVAADLASIGVPDVFAFLGHFVMGGAEVATFAGDAPIVTDDHTRLDFSVPRSLDAFFGFANANTDSWLVDLMRPERERVGIRIFLEKVQRMNRFVQPVAPHLVHVDDAGLDPETVRAGLARLTAQDGSGGGQPAGNSP